MTDPRPKLSWSDLAGTRAGVWGLGREGRANLRKLLALGAEPVLVDDRPPGPVDGRPVLATSDGDDPDTAPQTLEVLRIMTRAA